MFCGEPAGVMEQEQAYLAALTQVVTYNVDGDRLELRSADGAVAGRLHREAVTPRPRRNLTSQVA